MDIMCGGQNSTEGHMVLQASLSVCYVIFFERKGP